MFVAIAAAECCDRAPLTAGSLGAMAVRNHVEACGVLTRRSSVRLIPLIVGKWDVFGDGRVVAR